MSLQLNALYGRYRNWTRVENEPQAIVVQFEASAREDLRVGFAEDKEWTYEVALGAEANTELVWRKNGKKETDLLRVFSGRTCSATEFVKYWVLVDLERGEMAVGVGELGEDVLAHCRDESFVKVSSAAFTTWNTPATLRDVQIRALDEKVDVKEPRLIVRGDPKGLTDLLTPEQKQQYEAEYAASKRRAERFGAPFTAPDIKKLIDPRDVRKLQRTGAIEPGFATGIDVTSQEEQSKREQRMKRFDTPQFAVEYSAEAARALAEGMTQEQWAEKQQEKEKLRARAQKFGLSAEEDRSQQVPAGIEPASAKVGRERCDVKPTADGGVTFRDDSLHLYSPDERFQQVRTSDVLAYFAGYGPAYVEWFNDSSCTVVFHDQFSSSRALIALSQELPPRTLKQEKAEPLGDVEMADAEANDSAMDEGAEVPDVAFNRSQWRVGNPIGSSSQPRDKKWRLLLRKATDDDFPPEKLPKKGTYHSRNQPARGSRRRSGRDRPSRSRDSRARAHPYGFREDRRGEEPAGRRRKDTRDTGKPSKRIRVNPDGSINIVRDEKETSAPAESKPDTVKSETATMEE